jgi:drug/metabolite transporter (DMT)-like permease
MDTSSLFALAAAASWAVGSLFFGVLGRRVSPSALNFTKCATAAAMLGLTLGLRQNGNLEAPVHAWALIAASAIAGLTIGDTAYFHAIRHLGVGRAILLGSTAPLFATFGGIVAFGEHVGLRELAGMALTAVGVLAVLGRPSEEAHAGSDLKLGVLLGLGAAIMQAVGTMLARGAMRHGIDPLAAATARVTVAAASLVVIAAARGELGRWRSDLSRGPVVLQIGGAAFIGTYGGIWLAQLALAGHRSTGVTSALLATSPVFALPIERFVLGVKHGPRAFLGACIAVAGIALLST